MGTENRVAMLFSEVRLAWLGIALLGCVHMKGNRVAMLFSEVRSASVALLWGVMRGPWVC